MSLVGSLFEMPVESVFESISRKMLAVAVVAGLAGTGSLAGQTVPFSDCGTLVPGIGCAVLFEADSGGLYLLEDFGGFAVGDVVLVEGVADPFCISICFVACIFDNTIEPCLPPVEPDLIRADSNQDGTFDIADPVNTLAILFQPGTPPSTCDDALDANDDGAIDISDPIFSLSALFSMGADPEPPFPGCGVDPTADMLTCDAFGGCP